VQKDKAIELLQVPFGIIPATIEFVFNIVFPAVVGTIILKTYLPITELLATIA